jgi:hypothetical protein
MAERAEYKENDILYIAGSGNKMFAVVDEEYATSMVAAPLLTNLLSTTDVDGDDDDDDDDTEQEQQHFVTLRIRIISTLVIDSIRLTQ